MSVSAHADPLVAVEIEEGFDIAAGATFAVFDPAEEAFIVEEFTVESWGGDRVTVTARIDRDSAAVTYSIEVIDRNDPSTFFITISMDPGDIPPFGSGSVKSLLTVSLFNPRGGVVEITPTLDNLQVSQASNSSSNVNLGVDLGTQTSGPGFVEFGPKQAQVPAGGPWTILEIQAGFGLSGGGSVGFLVGKTAVENNTFRIP